MDKRQSYSTERLIFNILLKDTAKVFIHLRVSDKMIEGIIPP